MSARSRSRRGRRDERGAIGGVEMLPLGVLVFVGGLLLVGNAWAVVDARFMTSAAAREAVRHYVEATDDSNGTAAGEAAARASAATYGADPDGVGVDWTAEGGFGRCARVTAVVRYEVPAFVLGSVASFPVRASATEIVDPYRDDVGGGGCAA